MPRRTAHSAVSRGRFNACTRGGLVSCSFWSKLACSRTVPVLHYCPMWHDGVGVLMGGGLAATSCGGRARRQVQCGATLVPQLTYRHPARCPRCRPARRAGLPHHQAVQARQGQRHRLPGRAQRQGARGGGGRHANRCVLPGWECSVMWRCQSSGGGRLCECAYGSQRATATGGHWVDCHVRLCSHPANEGGTGPRRKLHLTSQARSPLS